MRKLQDIVWNPELRELHVFTNSKKPAIKGVRAKGQRFLHLNGIHDGELWHIEDYNSDNGTWSVLRLYSPTYTLKKATEQIGL